MGTLIIGIAVSALVTWWHANNNAREAQSAFETHSQEVVDRLSDRMRRYEYGLRGARGAVLTAGEHGINYHLFQQYSTTRDVDAEFPGARGFGFIRRVPRSQTENYLRNERADDRPDFAIKTLTEHEDERFVIEYIEPIERNSAAVGLDIGSESNRRQAAISAMQTGQATITGPITLVQASGDPQRSLLFLLPIYRGGTTPGAIEAREFNAFGWSYAPLSLSDVMADFNIAQLHYDLVITDISDPTRPESVFNTLKQHPAQTAALNQALEREMYGRLWRIELSARPGFVEKLHLVPAKAVLGGSLLTSLLLSLLMGTVQVGRERKRKSILQQAQLATIVENSADAIIGESTDGQVIIWNRAAERLFGYQSNEALGQPMIARMTLEDERGKEAALVRQVLTGGAVTPTDTVVRAKDGTLKPISVTAGAIRGGTHGEIIGIARLMRDISERIHAEQALRELTASLDQQVKERTAELETARHDLQTVLDSVPSMIGYWDHQLRNRVANQAYRDWFDVDPAALPGKPMAELLGEELFALNRPHIEGALRGEPQHFERSFDRPDGLGRRHALSNYLPDIVDGKVRGFYVIVHDITDIVESRQAFAQERERLAHIIEGTNVGTWELNVQTGAIIINERWAEMIGYTLAELIPTDVGTWQALSHPDDLPVAQELLQKHFDGEHSQYQSVVRMRHKAGHWVWVQSRGRVLTRTPQGAPEWMYGTHQDITPMKLAEEHLRQVVATLGGVLGAATEQSIIATDLEGTITLFNTGAEKMLGYAASEMVGVSTPAPLHVAQEIEDYGRELSSRYGYPVQGFQVFVHEAERLGFESREWTYVRKDGQRLRVQLSVSAIRDAQGSILGYLGIAQDMTARHRQDQILRHAKAAAETANAAKSMFLANMSHEIRTPMNAVLGVAHLLADTPLDEDQRQLLNKLQIAGRSLLGIINDVLDISKIEAGEMTTESVAFRPAELLTDLLQLYSPQAVLKAVSMELQGLETVPAALVGDPTRLRQVLSNLLSNAIKFTARGSVSLRVTREPSTDPLDSRVWLQFSVVDTGEGISEAALKSLFTPFAQADASTTRRFGGTGLGLSIVKRLRELMNGNVGVHSTPGIGSTFWVRLPFAVVDSSAPSVQAVSSQDRLSVFVVEDDDADRAGLVQICQAFGWRTTALDSGAELVQRMQELVDGHLPLPDALIVDWDMPGGGSIQALRTLSERLGTSALPAALALSAAEGAAGSAPGHTSLIDRMLTRPVNSSTLFNAINTAVAAHTQQQNPVEVPGRQNPLRGTALQGLHILLVDDSEINLEVARRLLQREGATVEVRGNGQDALQALRGMETCGVAFDAVLMDVQMPIMDGYEATQRARKDLGLTHLPIIALTAGALSEERTRAEDAGMDDFLTKPLDPALLIRTVRERVSRVRALPPMANNQPHHPPVAPPPSWPDVDGIDTRAAASLMHGDTDLFILLLERFVREYGAGIDSLTDVQHTEKRQALIARVHKLRGSAGMLGANGVYAIASALEARLRDVDTQPGRPAPGTNDHDHGQEVATLIQSLNASLKALGDAATQAIRTLAPDAALPLTPPASEDTTPPASLLSEALRQKVQALQQLLARQDLSAIDLFEALAPELAALMNAPAMASLGDAIRSLDFSTAARVLADLLPEQA